MDELLNYITEELVITKIKAEDEASCLRQLGSLMVEKGFVKETYVQAVVDREKVYPTGLFTNKIGVAIPHTDAIHVHKPAVAIGTLDTPIQFNLMGGDGEKVEVWLIFQLAISSPGEQVQMLQNLVGLFTNDELLESLRLENDEKRVIELSTEALSK